MCCFINGAPSRIQIDCLCRFLTLTCSPLVRSVMQPQRSSSVPERDEVSSLLADLRAAGEASVAKLIADTKDDPSPNAVAAHSEFQTLIQHMRTAISTALTLLPDFNMAHKSNGTAFIACILPLLTVHRSLLWRRCK
jgi:hypothetical protein